MFHEGVKGPRPMRLKSTTRYCQVNNIEFLFTFFITTSLVVVRTFACPDPTDKAE
jgi:hypothetical protein